MIDYALLSTVKNHAQDIESESGKSYAEDGPTITNVTPPKKKKSIIKKTLGSLLFILIVGAAVVIGVQTVFSQPKVKSAKSPEPLPQALSVPIDKEYSFKAYDKFKKLSKPLKYTISSAELTKQIVIKGQKATAVKGRIFLIFTLKLTNESEEPLYMNTRSYVRVQPVNSVDKLAPEIHNDTVEVQPLSTKITRIGLPVNDTDKEFILTIGEIDAEKDEVKFNF